MTTILYASNDAYDRLVTETVDQLVKLGIFKGGEYASGNNRLENFVHNAIELGLEPEHVWAVYAAKHWDAIRTYVIDTAKGIDRNRSEPIEGRADDLMVYLMLFKALVNARRNGGRFELEASQAQVSPRPSDMIPSFLTTAPVAEALGLEEEAHPESVVEAELAQAVAKSANKKS